MLQFLIRQLIIVVYGSPVLAALLLALFMFKKNRNLKPTENTLGFLCLIILFVAVPFFVYVAGVLRTGKGFLGYYLAIPGTISRLYSENMMVLIHFVLYLVAIHILGILPFFAILKIALVKNRLKKAISAAERNEIYAKGRDFQELENLVKTVKAEQGISKRVDLKAIDNEKADRIIGSANCAILKLRNFFILVISSRFLELFSKGLITKDESKAIFHHEFSHIANRDYFMPVTTKAILSRKFVLLLCFTLAYYLGITTRYSFFVESRIIDQTALLSLPMFLSISIFFIAICLIFGFCLWLISLFLQRCELLADNFALQYIARKPLIDSIAKMSIVSESSGLMAMQFSSQTNSIYSSKRKTLIEDIMHSLRTMNVFSDYNKSYVHPSLSERIKFLNNPKGITEEEESGLLRFDVFGGISAIAAGASWIILFTSSWLIRNVNLQDTNLVSLSYMMYFGLVLLACSPLRYAEKPLNFDGKGVKLMAIYSALISTFCNLGPLIVSLNLIFQDYPGRPGWLVRMFIKSQIKRVISLLINGFFLSVVLFVVFISIGNLIIRMKMKKKAFGKQVAA